MGIVSPKYPDYLLVGLESAAGQSFGLLGALVDSGLKSGREDRFKKIVGDAGAEIEKNFQPQLISGLTSNGFKVLALDSSRTKTAFLENYPQADVDAYLDVVFLSFGYVATGLNQQYQPHFNVKVRLVDARKNEILMDRIFTMNGTVLVDHTQIATNGLYGFKDVSEMEGQTEKVIEGLKYAISQASLAVTASLGN